MGERELAEVVQPKPYFATISTQPVPEYEDGTRDMGELFPFIISGGSITERYYFTHINDITAYKFNIRPRYFGDESSYTEAFPKRIEEVLKYNTDAKIFCIFDWDTVYGDETRLRKHKEFEERIKDKIASELVTLCPTMPCIEYWFLLHFVDCTDFMKDFPDVLSRLGGYLKPYFKDSTKKLKKLLKMEKYVKDPAWVEKLCADGKLDIAIERAGKNLKEAIDAGEMESRSYTYVYKAFRSI